MAKEKEVYKEIYKKGVFINNKDEISKALLETGTTVELINSGKYNSGNFFITIKINYKS